jgi:hypothetical protein
MTASWINPNAPRRAPLRSPGFRRRQAQRLAGDALLAALELLAVSTFIGGLLAMLEAIIH